MISNGKRARRENGMNRSEIKRAMRRKTEVGTFSDHDASKGTNARKLAKRNAERR